MDEAWDYHVGLKKQVQNYMDCRLDCNCSQGYGLIIANNAYTKRFWDTTAWYEMDFICAFLAQVNHSFHLEVPEHY